MAAEILLKLLPSVRKYRKYDRTLKKTPSDVIFPLVIDAVVHKCIARMSSIFQKFSGSQWFGGELSTLFPSIY